MSSYLTSAFRSLGLSSAEPDGDKAKHAQPMFVYAGPDTRHLVPATVNDPASPMDIENDNFVGRVLVRVKDYGQHKGQRMPEYFAKPNRRRKFALLIQGRFKHDTPASDVYFGGAFDHKATQPAGFWLIWKVATLIDPSLLCEWSDKPYFFSPIVSALNVMRAEPAPGPIPERKKEAASKEKEPHREKDSHRESAESDATLATKHSDIHVHTSSPNASHHSSKRRSSISGEHRSRSADRHGIREPGIVAAPSVELDNNVLGSWPLTPPHPDDELAEDTEYWFDDCGFDEPPVSPSNSSERRRYFRNPRHLADHRMVFKKDHVYTFEIFAPFIDLNTYDLSLGVTLNMKRYCEDQHFRLIMCSAKKDEDGLVKWTEGRVCLAMEFRLREWMDKHDLAKHGH